jgi:hypothetical protein
MFANGTTRKKRFKNIFSVEIELKGVTSIFQEKQ